MPEILQPEIVLTIYRTPTTARRKHELDRRIRTLSYSGPKIRLLLGDSRNSQNARTNAPRGRISASIDAMSIPRRDITRIETHKSDISVPDTFAERKILRIREGRLA